MTNSRLEAVLSAIDNINKEDPNYTVVDGVSKAKELLYGHYMSACLEEYWQETNELLKIAVRAQHIKRWHLKRTEFDEGKAGYFKWRIALGKFHAQLTEAIMLENDYSTEESQNTAKIIRKEKLKSNSDSQTLEDVACLVFLQHYFDEFAGKHSEDKIIRILQKTWGKMSDKAHDIALSFSLPEHLAKLVNKALS
ncbi:MAG: DUF4202 domain-containing protein [Alteromonadaceae bacterium]|nr:DUF4202 domain-containing protein [Alteromonadaceae bacterium]